MLWAVASISTIALMVLLRWYYLRNLDWQLKRLTTKANRIIHCKQPTGKATQALLKKIYIIINKSLATDNSIMAYKAFDLLKLVFGYGIMRPDEPARLMAICVGALHRNKLDIVSFVLDAFRPLVRELPSEATCSAIDQLTLISVVALRKRQNFLAAKVVECIFYIIEQINMNAQKNISMAAINALKVIGIFGLRRRDTALFREINTRITLWLMGNPKTSDLSPEIVKMMTAWLHRIAGNNEELLFTILTDGMVRLVEVRVLSGSVLEEIVDEWGNIAASACLNPTSPMSSLIMEFLFKLAHKENTYKLWKKLMEIAGRVAKLAVSRHGVKTAFMVVYPLLEFGRNLLWAELKFIEYVDELRHRLLFEVVRECLIILSYAARQNLLGSTGETISEMYKGWIRQPNIAINHKSIKKYCQFLLLFWLKNKRQAKKYMPSDNELTEPLLFSNSEKLKLGI